MSSLVVVSIPSNEIVGSIAMGVSDISERGGDPGAEFRDGGIRRGGRGRNHQRGRVGTRVK